VIGKVSKGNQPSKAELQGLYTIAREVFFSQPTRLFLHCFLISGFTVELWVYDHSGPYSSMKFSLHEDSGQLAKIMTAFTLMLHEELGLEGSEPTSTVLAIPQRRRPLVRE
jgi:hypothetical protein